MNIGRVLSGRSEEGRSALWWGFENGDQEKRQISTGSVTKLESPATGRRCDAFVADTIAAERQIGGSSPVSRATRDQDARARGRAAGRGHRASCI